LRWPVLYPGHVVALAGFRTVDEADADDSGAQQALATLPGAAERANEYASRSKSEATIKAYAAGWRDFLGFCEQRGASALPADDQTVAAYLADMADRSAKAATIARRLVVISQAHRAADLPSPTTRRWCGACTPACAAR
jgi:hypothetical protein